MSTKIYRIRNSLTRLFSLGGNPPRWSKNGKFFLQENHLTCHFTNLLPFSSNKRKGKGSPYYTSEEITQILSIYNCNTSLEGSVELVIYNLDTMQKAVMSLEFYLNSIEIEKEGKKKYGQLNGNSTYTLDTQNLT